MEPGGEVYTMNAANVDDCNNFQTPEAVGVRQTVLEQGGDCLNYTFPAHSLTMFRFIVDERASYQLRSLREIARANAGGAGELNATSDERRMMKEPGKDARLFLLPIQAASDGAEALAGFCGQPRSRIKPRPGMGSSGWAQDDG